MDNSRAYEKTIEELRERLEGIMSMKPVYRFILEGILSDMTGLLDMVLSFIEERDYRISDLTDEHILFIIEEVIYQSKH